PKARVDSDTGEDEFRSRSIQMGEDEATNQVIPGIHLHEDFLEIRLSFRKHPHYFCAFKEWFRVKQFKSSEFASKIGLLEEKHQRNSIIKRLLYGFLIGLAICRYIEINGLAVGDEKLLFRVLVFPPHHSWPHQI